MRISRNFLNSVCAAAILIGALPSCADRPVAHVAHLKVGDAAPLFAGRDQDCNQWKLARHLGKKVVLLCFYPEDNTTGTIAETCGLCDNMFEIKQAGVDVVAVSFDNKKTQKEFIVKYNLNYPLLADASGQIADAYGARISPDRK